jgi:hypothetical protein
MKTFKLVNPYIKGNMTTTFSGNDSLNAAQSAWEELGQNISKGVPKFYFTLQDSKKKLTHFYVKETLNDGLVDYRLSKLNNKVPAKATSHFKTQLEKFENTNMSGGIRMGKRRKSKKNKKKKKRCSDCGSNPCECDDSSSEEVGFGSSTALTYTSPIGYMYYDPIVYGFDDVYMPNIVGSVPLLNYYTGIHPGHFVDPIGLWSIKQWADFYNPDGAN